MFDVVIIETAIGLIMVFAVFALLTTAVQEIIATWTHARAHCLRHGICNLLYAQGVVNIADRLYAHPMIRTIEQSQKLPFGAPLTAADIPRKELPSYIPSAMFSSVLLDVLRRELNVNVDDPRSLVELRRALESSTNGERRFSESNLGHVILHLIDRAERRVQTGEGETELLEEIAGWYEAVMERVSGWYKRYTQKQVLWLGFVLAAFFNVDAVQLAATLHRDPNVRARAVTAAEVLSAQRQADVAEPAAVDTTLKKAMDNAANAANLLVTQMNDAGMPIGWKPGMLRAARDGDDVKRGALRIVGWMIVAITGVLGAPFWFDLLQRFVTIRGAGTKPAPKTAGGTKTNTAGDKGAGAAADLVAASGPPQ